MDNVRTAYLSFLNKVPFYGLNVVCLDHEEIQTMLPKLEKRYITYGLNTQADIQANAIEYGAGETSFELIAHGNSLGRFKFEMLGQHNVLNCLAACAVAFELEVPPEQVREALAEFSGIQRRFQFWHKSDELMLVDDYAHHPTEIKASLAGARSAFRGKRVIAVFQPHRYSRVRDLYQEFVTSFYQADVLYVMDVYAAGEQPIDGVDSKSLAQTITEHGHNDVRYVSSRDELMQQLREMLDGDDLVITLGAGDVWTVVRDLAEEKK